MKPLRGEAWIHNTSKKGGFLKRNHFQFLSRCLLGMLVCVVFSSTIALSQKKMVLTPYGEVAQYKTDVTIIASIVWSGTVTVSAHSVGVTYIDSEMIARSTPLWHPRSGYIVASKVVGEYAVDRNVKVLLDDGSLIVLDYRHASYNKPPKEYDAGKLTKKGGSESWMKVVGDATYVLSTYFVYVYRDSVSSWQVDTTGLGSATINDISLDTAQYVYAATSNGVFKQNPDSSVWHQITNLPTNNFQSIFVDRRNRIFAAYYPSYNGQGTYISTDNDSSWTPDSVGIGTMQILKLSDDAYGNTYAIANGYEQVYRRANNTPGWTRVDGGITAITVNATTMNSIEGDSVLFAATSFGSYRSTDHGTTWREDNAGNPAENFYAFARGAGGKWFTTTNLGMYSLNPTDTAWIKVFPTSGYMAQLPIYTDGLGNIYTSIGTNNGLTVYESSNNGSTWNADSVGLNLYGLSAFFIDEKGGQHIATGPYSGTCLLYSKPFGGSWGLDTAGFQLTSNYSYSGTYAIASDRHGYLYISGTYLNGSTSINGKVMRRPIDGGTWVPDTLGLSAYGYFDRLVPGKNADMYGTFRPHLVHRSNGTWSALNTPSIANSTINSMALSVDSSGALFVAIMGHDANYVYRGLGVYFSRDTGATWTFAGGDSIDFTKLVSYGDSTYACSGSGLYIFTRKAAGTTGVRPVESRPMTFALFQNYPNPFNPTTDFEFRIVNFGFVSLKVFDELGREVATLVNEIKQPGEYRVRWKAEGMASGIYFYRLEASSLADPTKSFVQTRKMLLLK